MKKFLIILLVLACCFSLSAQAIYEERVKAAEGHPSATVATLAGNGPVVSALVDAFNARTGYAVEYKNAGADIVELSGLALTAGSAGYKDIRTAVPDGGSWIAAAGETKAFAYVVSATYTGISFNPAVLTAAGVDPESILTWADFEKACQAIRFAGMTPIAMTAEQAAWVYELAGAAYVLPHEVQAERFVKGGIDPVVWDQVSAMIDRWVKKGYVKVADGAEALVSGDAGFAFLQEPAGEFIPVPASTPEGEPFYVLGVEAFAVAEGSEVDDLLLARFFKFAGIAETELTAEYVPLFGFNFFPAGEPEIAQAAAKGILAQDGAAMAQALAKIKAQF
ncbi:MAG: hypothetical protein J5785_01095 [Spirochaetales bacterium]|nr:hypothetical protein [Spirochaetales bacterium]